MTYLIFFVSCVLVGMICGRFEKAYRASSNAGKLVCQMWLVLLLLAVLVAGEGCLIYTVRHQPPAPTIQIYPNTQERFLIPGQPIL